MPINFQPVQGLQSSMPSAGASAATGSVPTANGSPDYQAAAQKILQMLQGQQPQQFGGAQQPNSMGGTQGTLAGSAGGFLSGLGNFLGGSSGGGGG